VEQNANAALNISDYSYILETGSIALEGESKELLKSELVKEKYLGA
jgi:branched-chain amino acid transport system ATP-binding protein